MGKFDVLKDPRMKNGFQIASTTDHAPDNPDETVDFFGTAEEGSRPDWKIVQWWSKKSIADAPLERWTEGDKQVAELRDETKRITAVGGSDGIDKITLEMLTSLEYDRPRKDGEVWPHIGFEQGLEPLYVSKLKSLVLSVDLTVDKYVCCMDESELDPNLHAGMLGMGYIVQNVNPDSKDFHEFYWLQFRLYDERFDVMPEYIAIDGGKEGASGKLIYAPSSKDLFPITEKGVKTHLSFDTYSVICKGYEEARERGLLKNTEFEDLAVIFWGLSWELFGTYDVCSTFENLTLQAESKE